MELRKVMAFYRKYFRGMLLGSLLALLVGLGLYFLPPRYVASGSFVVVRDIENREAEFSYEGYYAQLTSQDFSKNLISFFKNESILSEISKDLNMDQSELKRRIRVVKEAPSVTRLEVRHPSSSVARDIWEQLRDSTLGLVERINSETNSGLEVILIGDEPVIRQSNKNIYIYGMTGALTGLAISTVYFALKEYLK